jgi:predicted amidohydrolase
MALLSKSGGYCAVLDARWAPDGCFGSDSGLKWHANVKRVAESWRNRCLDIAKPPEEVASLWGRVTAKKDLRVDELEHDWELCCDLLTLVAISDEACEGAGLRRRPVERDDFVRLTSRLLTMSSEKGPATLCLEIHPTKAQVLPKLHTPQSGLTMRSLSHHLALCPGGSVEPHWVNIPPFRAAHSLQGLNLLVIPWPKRIVPTDFEPAPNSPRQGKYGVFRYLPTSLDSLLADRVAQLIEVAEEEVGVVDVVVFPELSLSEDEYERIRVRLHERGTVLVAGVRSEPKEVDLQNSNSCRIAYRATPGAGIEIAQDKHHRWKLDRQQIRQYGIGSSLDPTRVWWEDSPIRKRTLWFVGLNLWITASVLICEDLARQEPVSELVRSVGPNLVIALLMDGPQLDFRWPARYATVLADDPGCSVLTVTSLGMARMSRSESGASGSRVVAMWKDDKDGRQVPIELPQGADAIVLSLARETKEEWTADGRSGPGRAFYPTLVGINPVACVDAI